MAEEEERPAIYTQEISDMFDKAKDYMNFKRDKQEEITRYSKDITWASKQIIFTLHKFFRGNRSIIEAKERLNAVISGDKYFLGLAKALDGQDFSCHHRQYTHSLQEFVEAMIFLSFLENRRIPTYEELRDKLILEVPIEEKEPTKTTDADASDDRSKVCEVKKFRKLVVPLSVADYIYGLGDFTGELMKSTVPTLTKPQWHTYLFQSFVMVREIYSQLMSVGCNQREFKQKMKQMRANVVKIETTVYKLKIKILLYGRLPDQKEMRMIQESANAPDDRRKEGRNEADDSGVE